MAGIKFPPGAILLQPIVHVDSPKIVDKYEAMTQKVTADAADRVALIQYDLNEALRENLALEKKMSEKEADLLAMANLKNPSVQQAAPADWEELRQLRLSVVKLKEELASAYRTMRALQERQAIPEIIPKVERVVEYQDREKIVTQLNLKAAITVALVSILLGILVGSIFRSPKSPAQAQLGEPPYKEKRNE